MARPRKTAHLTTREAGVVALVSYGRLTVAEGTMALGCHRTTLGRLLKAAGVSPTASRRAYVNKLLSQAEGIGRRPLTKAQLRERGVRAVVDHDV